MNIEDLPWGERTVGGILKSHFSLTKANFEVEGQEFVALEWFRRTDALFNAYASYIVIATECEKTGDDNLMKKIAFGKGGFGTDTYVRVEHSDLLDRKILLCSNPDRTLDLDAHLQELSA